MGKLIDDLRVLTDHKRGRGRPPGKSYVEIKAQVTPEQLAKLDRLASKQGMSRAKMIRIAVDILTER